MMIAEVLYLALVSAIGAAALAIPGRACGVLFSAGAAFPVGVAITALAQLSLAAMSVKLNPASLWLTATVLLIGLGALTVRSREVLPSLASTLGGAVLMVLVVWVVQQQFHFAVLSYDSYDYVVVAANLYRSDTALSSDAISGFLTNYAPLLWLSHAPARLLDQEFLTLFHPLVFLSILVSSAGLVETCTRGFGMHVLVRTAFIITPVLVLCATPQIVHHASYVMPNMLTAAMLLVATGFLWCAEAKRAQTLVLPAALCLAAVVLARQEGGLMCALILALFATAKNIAPRTKVALSAFVAAIATAWYFLLVSFTGPAEEGSILTPLGALLQLGSLWATVVIAALNWAPKIGRPLLSLADLAPAVLLAALVAYTIVKPAHAIESIGVFVVNMTWPGSLWGPWWLAALGIGALAVVQPTKLAFSRMFSTQIAALVILICLLGIVRSIPYRLGDQDSGNRMLIHIYPLMWAYFSVHFASLFRHEQAELKS